MTVILPGPGPSAGGFQLVLDPTSEDADNAELVLVDSDAGLFLMEFAAPPPERDVTWVSSADTEGEGVASTRYRSREIVGKLRVRAASAVARDQTIQALESKVAKVNAEGGTLKLILPGSGYEIVFDLLDGGADLTFGNAYIHRFRSEVEVKFVARPFGRGTPETRALHSETTLPCLIFEEVDIPGDVPALVVLEITEDSGNDQLFVVVGVQSRYYDASANAALFYQAESRTPLGGAATAAGATGASGSGSNVVRHTDLTPTWRAILSTQASGAGAHLQHIGDFRVFARLYRPTSNAGAVSVRLEWGEGDFRRRTPNDVVTHEVDGREGQFLHVDLGIVNLTKVAQGAQRWEGRILAKSTTTGDEIDVDCLYIVPVTEGYSELRGLLQFENPTTLSAADTFVSTGALTGQTATTGGAWAAHGDATDATVVAGNIARRSVTVDSSSLDIGRLFYLPVSMTDTAPQVDISATDGGAGGSNAIYQGVIARRSSANDYMRATVELYEGATNFVSYWVAKVVGGTQTILHYVPTVNHDFTIVSTLRLSVDGAGRWHLWHFRDADSPGSPIAFGYDSDLATGGALASGDPGWHDANIGPATSTRDYKNFSAFAPLGDAALFANESLELHSDRAIREDSGGAIWSPVSDVTGYIRVPPAGAEGRTVRVITKASRNDPDTGPDAGIDGISAQLSVTPRYLVVPSN